MRRYALPRPALARRRQPPPGRLGAAARGLPVPCGKTHAGPARAETVAGALARHRCYLIWSCPGGWAALLRYKGHERELSGGEAHTTNNRMELMAAISGLETLTEPCNIVLYTDSQYVRQGLTQWMPGWIRKNWKTAGGDPVKNRELWERLHAATLRHQIDWRWVKGHSGDPDNERVDTLARNAAIQIRDSSPVN
ncbi:hypothetical protein G6F24_015502 [Rhizopus arrhizus]|nr:hypothetical protein G6F24_015502 [Rhizopus arrhizus]